MKQQRYRTYNELQKALLRIEHHVPDDSHEAGTDLAKEWLEVLKARLQGRKAVRSVAGDAAYDANGDQAIGLL